jgi:hypothetical protein
MTPDQLKTLGELLYGRRWKSYMANDLGVDRHTVIGWVDRLWVMPPGRAEDVKQLASKRILAIKTALKAAGRTRTLA